jgi:hypothetical protein
MDSTLATRSMVVASIAFDRYAMTCSKVLIVQEVVLVLGELIIIIHFLGLLACLWLWLRLPRSCLRLKVCCCFG